MRLNDNIVIKKKNKSGYIVDPIQSKKTKINKTATIILEKLYYEISFKELYKKLSNDFNIDNDEFKKDIKEFVDSMIKKEVIVLEPEKTTRKNINSPRLEKATLQLTNNCNLRCRHCLSNSRCSVNKELITSQWKKVIDELYDLGVYDVVLTGGEIFTRSDIFELLEYMQGKFFINILSNALLLDEEKMDKLAKMNIYTFQVSLDGATKETNDFIRGEGTFEKILEKIKMLVERNFTVSIAGTITKRNAHELSKFIKIAEELKVKAIGLGEVIKMGRGKEMSDYLLSDDKVAELNEFTLSQLANHLENGIKVGPLVDGDVNFDFSPESAEERNLCGAIKNAIYISYDGITSSCLQFAEIDEFKSGNVINQSIQDIWYNSKVHNELRNLSVNDCKSCCTCKYKKICGGSCRAVAYKQTGDIKGEPYKVICKGVESGLNKSLQYAPNVKSIDEMLEILNKQIEG